MYLYKYMHLNIYIHIYSSCDDDDSKKIVLNNAFIGASKSGDEVYLLSCLKEGANIESRGIN
jgi:hypothetical protein